MQQLTNLKTVFKNKLFRIPDYQRGYAWKLRQYTDFWEDIISLEEGKNHYTGVLSLEEVDKSYWQHWDDDKWIIENKGYVPYFIVDGQQRLTTCIILIQAIIEEAILLPENTLPEDKKEEFELCDTKTSEIRREFIFNQRTGSIVRSYIFGYEKDNPSYEFLKTRIFQEESTSDLGQETLYTQNLENAKTFFKENIRAFKPEERKKKLEELYKKVTLHLLFNEYIIQNDVDVFVAFETMNNRGKKLSDLELLKNRLIYLSTLYRVDDTEKAALRKKVNESWGIIYNKLGGNKFNPLSDDDFLKAHWIMYFKYSRKTGEDYIHFLLDEHFSPKKVLEQVPITSTINDTKEVKDIKEDEIDEDDNVNDAPKQVTKSKLTVQEIADYSKSIHEASTHWFVSFNPIMSDLTADEQYWLDCLNRIGIGYFRPLVMSSMANKDITSQQRIELFRNIERFIFLAFRVSQLRSNYRSSEFYNASHDLYDGSTDVSSIIKAIQERLDFVYNDDGTFNTTRFYSFITDKFKYGSKDGYYGWSALRYFLYEYEYSLFSQSRTSTQKIHWDRFVNEKDTVSIEHILPQNPDKPCWLSVFGTYSTTEMTALSNTLGNLLALSQPKNSSLQNYCYKDKRADKNTQRGYFNGSYSETRVAEIYPEWTPATIKERGLELLAFMEKRWDIILGSETDKVKLLNLEFL